jgi:3-oxoacyl-[acyl-carrier-protein] synthase III
MKSAIKDIRIAGIRAVVPRQRHSFVEQPGPFAPEEAAKLHAGIGIYERRILPAPYCASDMCRAAAEGLLDQLGWAPDSVDVLIFVSQDADYVLPSTAAILQNRLGLSQRAACFDVTLGCSGFVYALTLAARLLGGGDARRALVLCGDNSTRWLHPHDKATLPLFGDAGSATALEYAPGAPLIHAHLGTDGSGARHIFVKAGGKRDPLIPTDPPRSAEENERLYRDARLTLNGAEVFAFTLRAVPPLLRETLADAGVGIEAIDWFVPHQANKMMLEHIRKKIGCPPERCVIDMERYGNVSSASIPLAIGSRLGETLARGANKMLLAGFGVGWSWGAIVADVGPIPAPAVAELPEGYPTLEP